jgi:hypothetical protein
MLLCIFLSAPEISGAEISSYTKQLFQAFHDTVYISAVRFIGIC